MTCLLRSCLVLTTAVVSGLIAAASTGLAAEPQMAEPDTAWVASMKAVHEKFKGERGTFAQFGDSITVSRAFWFGLQYAPKNLSPEATRALALVKDYMLEECWDWKGPEFGSQGQMTIRWAHQNVDKWLQDLNPEVALMMFGTNDLSSLDLPEYETKIREVVQKCLANGTILILSTIPPKHGQAEKAAVFAEAVRRIARERKLPWIDYHAEILRRRPTDWDGATDSFRQYQGYDVPTLISRDGVHPSNPQEYANDYSDEALRNNGFALRSYLALLKYAEVIEWVLPKKPASHDAPRRTVFFPVTGTRLLKKDHRVGDISFFAGSPGSTTTKLMVDRLVFELNKLRKPLLELWVYDSDIWGYRLRNAGRLVASFNTNPTYFGRPPEPDLPIGTVKQGAPFSRDTYMAGIVRTWPHDLTKAAAPDVVPLYRRTLAAQPDRSVTLVAVGPATNISRLLDSGPDAFSPLRGVDLVRRKVRFYAAGGNGNGGLPDGRCGFNYQMDKHSARNELAKLPTDFPTVFAGGSGARLKIGTCSQGTRRHLTNPNVRLGVAGDHGVVLKRGDGLNQ
jgi:lysophospholipase L1-like esterase